MVSIEVKTRHNPDEEIIVQLVVVGVGIYWEILIQLY